MSVRSRPARDSSEARAAPRRCPNCRNSALLHACVHGRPCRLLVSETVSETVARQRRPERPPVQGGVRFAPVSLFPSPARVALGRLLREAACCTRCRVPWTLAPNLFQDQDDSCFVREQPTTAEEFAKMLEVMRNQELYCVRYQGHGRATLKALRNSGQESNCDSPSKD